MALELLLHRAKPARLAYIGFWFLLNMRMTTGKRLTWSHVYRAQDHYHIFLTGKPPNSAWLPDHLRATTDIAAFYFTKSRLKPWYWCGSTPKLLPLGLATDWCKCWQLVIIITWARLRQASSELNAVNYVRFYLHLQGLGLSQLSDHFVNEINYGMC